MKDARVWLIDASIPEFSPYLYSYIDILEKEGVNYGFIGWDRTGMYRENRRNGYHIYNNPTKDFYSPLRKLYDIYRYVKYVRKIIRSDKKSVLIVFTIPLHVFLVSRLILCKNKYILDIRDYSPLFKLSLVRFIYNKLISRAETVCISSKGFLEWLPHKYDYTICHNILPSILNKQFSFDTSTKKGFNILTIGSLRDYEVNIELIKNVLGDDKINLFYVGLGNAKELLEIYCKEHHATNVSFNGYYNKTDEIDIVKRYDFMSILMPCDLLSRSLMSNRFYLSVLCRKPMIVQEGSMQSFYVKKYNLGIVIDDLSNSCIRFQLDNYIKNFDIDRYEVGCKSMLNIITEDQNNFERKIKEIILI